MRTGLFFGSFNPIHIGHLAIAQYILNETELEQILLIVSPHNPLKNENQLLPADKRLEMVRLSIADNPRLKVSDIEFGLEKPSYTCNTLNALRKQFPDDEFSILMGSDTLEQLPLWKHPAEILAYPLIVYKRADNVANPYPDKASITLLNAPLLDISATDIRNMLGQNKDVKYLVRDEIINLLKNS